MNVFTGLFKKSRLPDHRADLQATYCNFQAPDDYWQQGEERQFPLYLLACLVTWGGAWLWGSGRRTCGLLIAALGLGMCLSSLTTIGLCDPLFWRPFERILSGQNPYRCQWDQQTDYRLTFQRDGGTLPQEVARSARDSENISGMDSILLAPIGTLFCGL
jgi:hypothetical protein